MTKVDMTLKLNRPLSEPELKSLARVHAVYGMLTVRLKPSGEELFIEYDASRLSPDEVKGTLTQHGIPVG
jgi:hypothetical protein